MSETIIVKVRILPSPVIKESLHGAECTLIERRGDILEVVPDESDKHDVRGPLCLPEEFFEIITDNTRRTQC